MLLLSVVCCSLDVIFTITYRYSLSHALQTQMIMRISGISWNELSFFFL